MEELILSPANIPILSRQNAKSFHSEVVQRIKDTGFGLFEYVEFIKFSEKLQECISGSTANKIKADQELRDMIRTEISKYGKEGFTTKRGAKFQLAEVGYKYDFEICGDPVYDQLAAEASLILERIAVRKEFLKSIPSDGLDIVTPDGEAVKIFPPNKTSTSSYKITLPK